MKAARLIEYDGRQAVAVEDVAAPAAAPGKLLVEVHEAGVNPLDWKIRAGGWPGLSLPVTLGGDFAGTVVAVGEGAAGFEPGQAVFGQAGFFSDGSGSFAEYDLVDPHHVAPRPAALDEAEAGALPLAGVMALSALTEHLRLEPGQKLLIHGGAGGIGSIAIQIAKHLGLYVATTCAEYEFDYVKELGADRVIDYRSQNFVELLAGYDGVYDLIGGEVYRRSFLVLKPGGTIVSTLEVPDPELMAQYDVTTIIQMFDVTTERLNRLAELVEQGAVKVHIDRTFPLAEADAAMTYQETVHPMGKVVIDVK